MVKSPERLKQVAAAFDDAVRMDRPSESSSGCDHPLDDLYDLSGMVESFIESETGELGDKNDDKGFPEDGDDGNGEADEDSGEDTRKKLEALFYCKEGGKRRRLREEMEDKWRSLWVSRSQGNPGLKREIMAHLRNKGFDAGLCKSRWERIGRTPPGQHDYIDVRLHATRVIVETNLAGEFQIARPTMRYSSLLSLFPSVFIGRPEDLKRLVIIMCAEMKRSMRRMGLHAPPWRKTGYMQAKWMGQYKRTTNNETPASGDVGRWAGLGAPSKTTAYWCKEECPDHPGIRVWQLNTVIDAGRLAK